MAKHKKPSPSIERSDWLRSLDGGSWVWLVPLVGNKRPARIESRAGILWVGQRRVSGGTLLPSVDTRASMWIEPMSADDAATHEHSAETAKVLHSFEIAFFGQHEGRERRRLALSPDDVVALRAMAAKVRF